LHAHGKRVCDRGARTRSVRGLHQTCWLRQHAPRRLGEAPLVVGVVKSDARAGRVRDVAGCTIHGGRAGVGVGYPGFRFAPPRAHNVSRSAAKGTRPSDEASLETCHPEEAMRVCTPTISESASAIVVHARGACEGFTKRVGSANMYHDGAAKRRWSWAWRNSGKQCYSTPTACVNFAVDAPVCLSMRSSASSASLRTSGCTRMMLRVTGLPSLVPSPARPSRIHKRCG
jgi:hypothetical protein